MKMKLAYNRKRTITTADMWFANDPPLTFEVWVKPPKEWADLQQELSDDKDNEGIAREMVSLAFLSVSDGGDAYEIDTVEKVIALENAIEENNPDYGAAFICELAWAFSNNHFSFLQDRLAHSPEPSKQSNDNGEAKTPVKA